MKRERQVGELYSQLSHMLFTDCYYIDFYGRVLWALTHCAVGNVCIAWCKGAAEAHTHIHV